MHREKEGGNERTALSSIVVEYVENKDDGATTRAIIRSYSTRYRRHLFSSLVIVWLSWTVLVDLMLESDAHVGPGHQSSGEIGAIGL